MGKTFLVIRSIIINGNIMAMDKFLLLRGFKYIALVLLLKEFSSCHYYLIEYKQCQKYHLVIQYHLWLMHTHYFYLIYQLSNHVQIQHFVLPWPFFSFFFPFTYPKSQGVYKTIPNSTSEYFSIFSITVIPLFTCSCKIIGSSPIFSMKRATSSFTSLSCPWTIKIFFFLLGTTILLEALSGIQIVPLLVLLVYWHIDI